MRMSSNNERQIVRHVHEGLLEICDDGSVWRIAELVYRKSIGRSEIRTIDRRRIDILTPRGYLAIQVNLNCTVTRCLSHRLVWQWFHGDIPPGMWINHINGVKSDNHPSNLELVTHSENVSHAYALGLMSNKGELNPTSKLSDLQAMDIRKRKSQGQSLVSIAAEFGVCQSTVSLIARGRTYKHLPVLENKRAIRRERNSV